MFSHFHPSVQEMKTPMTDTGYMRPMLSLLVQLPLSCDVTECKLLEPQSPDASAVESG